MRTFVMGDIHGNFRALKQCLELTKFDYENDTLIQLGDVVDGYDEVYECVEELLKIKNLISIKGNHDDWFKEFLITGRHPYRWEQGGKGTKNSYLKHLGDFKSDDVPKSHAEFFLQQRLYYIDKENRFFTHGGFNRHELVEETAKYNSDVFFWDRDLFNAALSYKSMSKNLPFGKKLIFKNKNNFKEIFIGHTITQCWDKHEPMNAANIWNLDTGAGWKLGRLSVMDVNTKEVFQSESNITLNADKKGR